METGVAMVTNIQEMDSPAVVCTFRWEQKKVENWEIWEKIENIWSVRCARVLSPRSAIFTFVILSATPPSGRTCLSLAMFKCLHSKSAQLICTRIMATEFHFHSFPF